MLLFDHLIIDQPSLEQHAFSIGSDSAIKVTKQAVAKRFNDKAVKFILKLFETFLAHKINSYHLSTAYGNLFSAIRIMDSTEFKLPENMASSFPGYDGDGTSSCAAIQFEYEILSKEIKCMTLTHARESDKSYADNRMKDIKPSELIVRDLGYYSLDSYDKIEAQGAFYISRLKSQANIYEKTEEGYQRLLPQELIRRIKKSKRVYFDQTVYIGAETKKKVRLMAWLLDEPAQQRRLQRKQNRKGKNKITAEDKVWSQLNVFITNVDAESLSVEQAYNLYRVRWQVELVFKTWKSILKIDKVRQMKVERFKCYLYSKLLWIVLNWDMVAGAEAMMWKYNGCLLSLYKCYALLKSKAIGLKAILFDAHDQLKEWLKNRIREFMEYGNKENRKNKPKVENSLNICR